MRGDLRAAAGAALSVALLGAGLAAGPARDARGAAAQETPPPVELSLVFFHDRRGALDPCG